MYVYCVESFAHIECYSDCSRRVSHLFERPLRRCYLICVVPLLKIVVFCTRVAWVCLVCFMLYKEEGSSPVSLQLLRGVIEEAC